MEVMILKLKSGEYIIAIISLKGAYINLLYPVEFTIEFDEDIMDQELIMNYWLPINFVEEQAVNIPKTDISFICTPKKAFKEFYLNFLDETKDIDSISKSLIHSMLNTIDNIDLSKYH